MNYDKLKTGLKQYIETRKSPVLVFIGIYGLIVVVLVPSDIVENVLSKTGFRAVYILILCIIILIGNLGSTAYSDKDFNPEA